MDKSDSAYRIKSWAPRITRRQRNSARNASLCRQMVRLRVLARRILQIQLTRQQPHRSSERIAERVPRGRRLARRHAERSGDRQLPPRARVRSKAHRVRKHEEQQREVPGGQRRGRRNCSANDLECSRRDDSCACKVDLARRRRGGDVGPGDGREELQGGEEGG